MYFAPFASTGLTPEEMLSALYGNQRRALTFKRLEVLLPRVQIERPVDLCYEYPATSKHNRRCGAWDGQSMAHLLNMHIYIGITSLSIWLQDHTEDLFSQNSAKRLSGVHYHRFCVLPRDVPGHLCDGMVHGSDNENVRLSALPVIRLDQELKDSTLHQDGKIRLHRFPEYSTDRIGLPSVVEPLRSIVVNNSTLESHVLRAIWKDAEYSVNYRGLLVEIPNGYVVGNFVYDKVRRYGLGGCFTEYHHSTPQTVGDTALQALPRRSHHSKLVLIRSWLSTNYYHMLVEAGPRILYVLKLVQSDLTIQLLVDPVEYGERRPHDELFAGLLGIPRSQIVDFDEWTVYSADTLYVPPVTPCENPPTVLLRKWSLTLRSALLRSVSGTDTPGTCMHPPRHVVVIVRKNEKAAKGDVLTSTEVDAMRTGDAEISTHLMRTLENILPVDVAVIPFYGNISMQETGALFQNADAVVGASGAGFANLVFSRPSTTVITYISRAFFEFSTHMRAFPEGSHTGMALKLGMRPRLVIVENLERGFPFEEVCSAVRHGLEQQANHRREECAASS
jgi:hypothetical protein